MASVRAYQPEKKSLFFKHLLKIPGGMKFSPQQFSLSRLGVISISQFDQFGKAFDISNRLLCCHCDHINSGIVIDWRYLYRR